jgi:hypothetical protein
MKYPKIGLLLLVLSGCQSTPKQNQVSSTYKERGSVLKNEPMPRPITRNRLTGYELNAAGSARTRNALIERGAIATVRTSRLIDMRYMLDLYEHNSKAKQVSEVLDQRDGSIRDCYTDRIKDVPELKGTLNFAFRYSRRTPGLHFVQRTGGSIRDSLLETCISSELQRIPVTTFVSGRGELRYSFKVVSQKDTVETLEGSAH